MMGNGEPGSITISGEQYLQLNMSNSGIEQVNSNGTENFSGATDSKIFNGLTQSQMREMLDANPIIVGDEYWNYSYLSGTYTYEQIKNMIEPTKEWDEVSTKYMVGAYFDAGNNIITDSKHLAIAQNVTVANLPSNANTIEYWEHGHIET